METVAGMPTLTGAPLTSYDGIPESTQTVMNKIITTNPASAGLPQISGGTYKIDMTVQRNSESSANEVRVRVKSNGYYGTTIGYDFLREQAFIVRESDGSRARNMPNGAQSTYDTTRTVHASGFFPYLIHVTFK